MSKIIKKKGYVCTSPTLNTIIGCRYIIKEYSI
jgi:hypothetical protein